MNYKFFFPRLLVDSLLLVCFTSFASGAKLLSPVEVQVLEDIGKTLGKVWNFSVDPCSGRPEWVTPTPDQFTNNNVTCGNCSTASSTTADQICHVTNIGLVVLLRTGSVFGIRVRSPCWLGSVDPRWWRQFLLPCPGAVLLWSPDPPPLFASGSSQCWGCANPGDDFIIGLDLTGVALCILTSGPLPAASGGV
ncbi:hypothetical protein M0R45_009266 [Rubus argutus]|uniref:Uncharacterized protein n=1 Tax=Rubus argutus TaxID=59490 RepID=A0AAW1Y618_RUBAR